MKIKRTTLPDPKTTDYAVLYMLDQYRRGLKLPDLVDLLAAPPRELHEPLRRLLSHGLIDLDGAPATYTISARGRELFGALGTAK